MDRNAIIRERFNELKERIIVKLIYIAAVLTLIAFSVPSMVVIRNVYNGHTPKIWWIGYQTPTPTENLVDKKMLEAIQETYWVKIQRKAAAVYKSVAMGGSFCADTTVSKFPLGNSLPGKLEPWVMDAVFSEGGSIATVILLERMRCSFSQKDWELAKKTAKSFGSSKDLIELESEGKVYIQSPETSLQFGSSGKSRSDFRKNVAWKVICKYYDRRSKLIGSVESLLILYQSVVRCPVPQDVRRLRKVDDRINLRLQLPDWSSLKETLEDGVASEKNKTSFIRSIARHMEAQLPLTKQFGICSTPSLKGKQLLEFFNSKTNSATDEEHRLLNESEMPSSSKQLSNNSLTIRNNDSHLRSESRQLMLIPKKKSPESMYRRDVMKKSKRKHIYNLAVCSALSPPYSSRRIIEWIEYHRLMGVEHFFLYDKFHPQLWSEDSESINSSTNRTIAKTGSSSMKSVRKASKYLRKSSTISRKLTAIFRNSTVSVEDDDEGEVRERIKKSMQLKPVLQDYIAMGLVTVISWPYAGCTETMRCETGIRIKRSPTDPVSGYTKVFYPPKPLYSAELSCYHRFRSTSRWIAMLDDDREFIGIDSKKRVNGKLNQNVPEMIANLESIHHNLAAIELHRMVYVPCSEDITASEMTPAIKRSCQKGTASEKCMLEMVKTDEDEIDLPRFDTLMYAVPYGALQRMATAPDISLWNRMSELVAAGSRQPQQHAVILNTDTVAAFRPRSRELYVEFLETIANYASLGVTAENPTMAQYDALSPKNQDVQRHHHHHHHHLQNNDSTAAANDDDTVDDDDDGLGSTLSTSIPLFSLYKRLFSFSVTSNAGADRSIPVKHKNIEANSTTLSKHMRKLTAERSESNRFDFTKRVEAKLLPSVPVTERTTATQAKNAREIALAKNEASAEKLKPREVLSRSYQIAKIDATIARLMMYRENDPSICERGTVNPLKLSDICEHAAVKSTEFSSLLKFTLAERVTRSLNYDVPQLD